MSYFPLRRHHIAFLGALWFLMFLNLSREMARKTAGSVEALVGEMRIIRHGDSRHHIQINTGDEFEEIAEQINRMAHLMRQSVYDATTGRFTLENFSKFFSKSYYFDTLLNSFKVSVAATVLSISIGTPLAYLFSIFKLRGKAVLNILIVVASMSAPFIGAYSWILLLGRSGVITGFFRMSEAVQAAVLPSNTEFLPNDFELIGGEPEAHIDNSFSSDSYWKDVRRRFFSNKSAVVALILIALIAFFAAVGPHMGQ